MDKSNIPARVVLAIDPGLGKCGVAVCGSDGILARAVVAPDELRRLVDSWISRYAVTDVVLGDRTGAGATRQALQGIPLPLRMVDEARTTLLAKARYFSEHPQAGWRRLVPRGLQTPPEPYDDYVAILLAERYLQEEV